MNQPPFPKDRTIRPLISRRTALSLVAGSALFVWPLASAQSAQAQTQSQLEPAAPTVRYARGENVDLSEIVSEWRGYYKDVPVYLCVCKEDTCNQTQQWPYREYARYQLGLALGPTNGRIAEDSGANCFDIADNSRPNAPRAFSTAQVGEDETVAENPTPPVAPPAAPPPTPPAAPPSASAATSAVPTATTINAGAGIRLTWPSGAINDIAVADSTWNINVLDALDCTSTSLVETKTLSAQRVVGEVAVDSETGNIAVPVLLDSCLETDQSAVFVLDPSEGGGYALYRTQLPGSRNFPDEFSSYAFNTLLAVRYWDGALYIQQGSASGAESVVIFRADRTPAGSYAGCGVVTVNEGSGKLCPAR